MKVIIVCSGNKGNISPFIREQVESINKLGIGTRFFLIQGKGIFGYLKNLPLLRKEIQSYNPDLIHAHFGLSGLLSGLQRKVPVIVTYHGSDINRKSNKLFSLLSMILAKKNIFVSNKQQGNICINADYIIPCGIDFKIFKPDNKTHSNKRKLILFASSFNNKVKNSALAREAVSLINESNIELIELKGYNRQEVNSLMNEVNVCLLTSFSEGSPQFIKEAMAVNCPIVSTDVGDVKWLFGDESGHYITTFDYKDVAEKIKLALDYNEKHGRTNGRERIIELGLDSKNITKKIVDVYIDINKEA